MKLELKGEYGDVEDDRKLAIFWGDDYFRVIGKAFSKKSDGGLILTITLYEPFVNEADDDIKIQIASNPNWWKAVTLNGRLTGLSLGPAEVRAQGRKKPIA